MQTRVFLPSVIALLALISGCSTNPAPADTVKPTVKLEASSIKVLSPTTITLRAQAQDNIKVVRVEFYEGTTKLGEDTTAPFELPVTFSERQNGEHIYTAKAFDAAQNFNVSALTRVKVSILNATPAADTTPPAVTLSASRTTVPHSGVVNFTASATDSAGISKVELYRNGVLYRSLSSAPYLFGDTFTSSQVGSSFVYTARAWDTSNNSTTSDPITVQVVPDTTLPQVTLSASSTSVTQPMYVDYLAQVTDNGTVSRVEFYRNGVLFKTDSAAPYEHKQSYTRTTQNGTYVYRAKAFDAAGNMTTSDEVTVTVNLATNDTPPQVTLSTSGTTITSPGSFDLTATATDNVSVSRVAFYRDGTLILTDAAAPFVLTQSFAAGQQGTHTYTARAYDNMDFYATSSPVTVQVQLPPDLEPPTVSLNLNPSTVTVPTLMQIAPMVSDNRAGGRVEFYRDGTLLGSDPSYPYSFQEYYNSISQNGTYTYTVKAIDAAGNTASASAVLNVNFSAADTTPPTLSLAASQTTIEPRNYTYFTATTSDNVGVGKVEFYRNGVLMGTDLYAPYQVSYHNPQDENYTIHAKSYDAAGNSTTSATINVQVSDLTSPSVALTASSTSVTSAMMVQFYANANDNRAVTRVEFYRYGTLLGTDTVSPFVLQESYTNAQNGTHTYTAKAFDAAGNNKTSNTLTVTVNITGGPDTTPPTISLQASPTRVVPPGALTLTTTASDNVGISKVEFYKNGTLVGTDAIAPYSYNENFYLPEQNGTHAYLAKAFDAAGNQASSSVTVEVGPLPPLPDTTPPVVSLSLSTQTVNTPTTVQMNVNASDKGGVSKVEFYRNGVLIGTDPTAPFNFGQSFSSSAQNGTYMYQVRAFDAAGNSTLSSQVTATVNIVDTTDTTPPSVNLAAQPNPIQPGGSTTLTATASDNVGVTRVEFYRDGSLLGSDANAPFVYTTVLSSIGNYSFTARAFDAAGHSTSSAPVGVQVAAPVDTTPPTVSLTASRTSVTTSGWVNLSVNASDNMGVTKVEFYRNGVLIGTDPTAPFNFGQSFSSSAQNGTYVYQVKAFDAAGNSAYSLDVTVTVALPAS